MITISLILSTWSNHFTTLVLPLHTAYLTCCACTYHKMPPRSTEPKFYYHTSHHSCGKHLKQSGRLSKHHSLSWKFPTDTIFFITHASQIYKLTHPILQSTTTEFLTRNHHNLCFLHTFTPSLNFVHTLFILMIVDILSERYSFSADFHSEITISSLQLTRMEIT